MFYKLSRLKSCPRKLFISLPTTSSFIHSREITTQPQTRTESSLLRRLPTNSYSIQPNRRFIRDVKEVTNEEIWEKMQVRRQFAKLTCNRYSFNRVAAFGPDLACLEWLMHCGATSVKMSDGTVIKSQKQMKDLIKSYGFDLKNPKPLSPSIYPLNDEELTKVVYRQSLYDERWSKAPKIYIEEIDASDSAIVDPGFHYFLEPRQIKKLILNFCDFFYDEAIKTMVKGRLNRTLGELEICFNGHITEKSFKSMTNLRALKKAHFYMNPWIRSEQRIRALLKQSLPKLEVTYPEIGLVGYGKEISNNNNTKPEQKEEDIVEPKKRFKIKSINFEQKKKQGNGEDQ